MPTATPWLVRVLDSNWRDDTNYAAGDLKFHNEKYWKALQPSGPDKGGAKEPGVDGNDTNWAEVREAEEYDSGVGIQISDHKIKVIFDSNAFTGNEKLNEGKLYASCNEISNIDNLLSNMANIRRYAFVNADAAGNMPFGAVMTYVINLGYVQIAIDRNGTKMAIRGLDDWTVPSWTDWVLIGANDLEAGSGISLNDNTISIDTDWLAGQMPSVPTYSAGTGISLTGTQFSVDTAWLAQQMPTVPTYTAGEGITVNGTQISVNA